MTEFLKLINLDKHFNIIALNFYLISEKLVKHLKNVSLKSA